MPQLLEDVDAWLDQLAVAADCEFEWAGARPECEQGHWRYALNHPALVHTRWGTIHAMRDAEAPYITKQALRDVYLDAVAHLLSDVNYAVATSAALGAGVELHEDMLEDVPRARPSELDVAFELPLPTLEHADPRQLIRLRENEYDSFAVFRDAIRTAIRERLACEGEATAVAVANEISEDIIQPSLNRIERDMHAASRLLARSGTLAVGVGTVLTTVGVLAGSPLVLGSILGPLVGLVDLRRFLADKREIELSDMYFLWRVESPHLTRRS